MKAKYIVIELAAVGILLCLAVVPVQSWTYDSGGGILQVDKCTAGCHDCMSCDCPPITTTQSGPGPVYGVVYSGTSGCYAYLHLARTCWSKWIWNGGGIPATTWINEFASYAIYSPYGNSFTYNFCSCIGVPAPGTTRRDRYYKVDSSSGVIEISGWVDGKGECSGYKYGVHVGTTWAFSILSNYTGPIADRKTIASPGRRGAPTYPARPSFSPVHGGCQEGDDPVDLATGEHVYIPCADISVYNPYGPGIVYQRNFLSKVAKEGYASAGQSVGWVDTYDVSMTSSDAQTWSDLTLRYPNSAEEDMTPVLDNDEPTGEFTEPTGSEFIVTGVPSGTTGQWQSISITFKDQTVWTFTPKAADSYVLTRISNRMGRYITINRDSNNNYQVTSIVDDSTPANSLLSFVYTNGYLTSVTDAYNRKVIYSYGSSAGTTCLLSTSQIGNVSDSAIPARWTYGYTAYVDPANPMGPAQPHVTSVSFPSPTGSGMSTETFNYNSDAQVESIVDDNGNQTEFSYKYTDGTIVSIKNLQDVVESQWIANFDPANGNIDTGITDATGYDIAYLYEDSTNPTKITKIVDQKRQETSLAYDQYGNITSTTTPRDTTTTYTYDYNNFALGRLTSIQEGTKPATTFTYYEPSGLVNTVVGPKPGTTGGSETVSTSFTYDSLGNVLTKVAPGNNATQTITTTYNYTTDGIYTQSAKIGQPVTITDQLGHITHIRYDSRGNVTESTDAIGNTTSFMYNIADQLSDIIHPVIP